MGAVERPPVALLPDFPGDQKNNGVKGLAHIGMNDTPCLQPPIRESAVRARGMLLKVRDAQEAEPNLPTVDASKEKVVGSLVLLSTKRTYRRLLETMARPSSCCPEPSIESQPEELDFGRRLGLPQLPGTQKCGRAHKEGAVCRRAGVLPIRGPFPSELVGNARREGHRMQPIVHLYNLQHDLLSPGTRNVPHPSLTIHRCAHSAPPVAHADPVKKSWCQSRKRSIREPRVCPKQGPLAVTDLHSD